MRATLPMSLNNLSHDLRTPLVGILGMTNFLIKENLSPVQKEYANAILSEAKRLLEVVNTVTSSPNNENPTALAAKLNHNFGPSANEAISCRVLLVEDTPIVQRVHSSMLKEIGCPFDLAVDAEQALAMVFNSKGEANYDVILMDIGLGEGMDGLETAAQIRQQQNGEQIRIIALSATIEDEIKKDHLAAQLDGFASKPIKIEKLKEIICSKKVP